jgi:FkbM family methyltransferase
LRGRLDRELEFLPLLVAARRTALDVGANEGLYTYALARWFDRVEAFEPLPESAAVIEAYGARNVRVHRVALAARSGNGVLHVPVEGDTVNSQRASLTGRGAGREVPVPLETIDHYGFENVSFIKIDVEGHELDVLQGAAATLAAQRPVLLVEIEQRHLPFPMRRVFEFLQDRGYHGYFVEGAELRPIRDFAPERHQEPFLEDVMSPRYVNDFFFLP